MSLFHVTIAFTASDVPEADRSAVLADERVAGLALYDAGNLQRIWRVTTEHGGPGSSVSIWSADDRHHLDGLLGSLPIAPWSRFDVLSIEQHPLEVEATRADRR